MTERRLKTHKLPLVCRFCGEAKEENLVKDPNYVGGRTRLCKPCQAERSREYRRGELISSYVGSSGRETAACRVCGEADRDKLVPCDSSRFGVRDLCKACRARNEREKRRAAMEAEVLRCRVCQTEDVDRLVRTSKSLRGYNRICYPCFLAKIKANKPDKPEEPLACRTCGTTSLKKLIVRRGKPTRMCRGCISEAIRMTYIAKKMQRERLENPIQKYR